MKSIKRFAIMFLTLLPFLLFVTSCSTVPLTGRRQLNIVPGPTVLSMSFQQYDEFLKTNKLSTNEEQTRTVKTVGGKIQRAVERYMAEKKLIDELRGYDWEFNLIESPELNAWCMPGGKVVVYTGLLPVTRDETGLAVVMGHEVAHAVAKHGNERMSQALVTQMGGMALSKAIEEKPEETRQLWLAAFGIGAQLGVLLPYSRLHESEADRLGLIFMAMAGYDPGRAVDFWERMAHEKGGAGPPEFLSTHPSDETRIRKLKELIPEALPYYEKSR
ncbi:MAG: M48 family metallopeptidase [Candidatus Eiseniibacteriota bacterium]|nr:MAG: M48 family metallopeptidase [Candidatus Eisenbacteria bacterium]